MTANAQRGEVEFEAGGETYRIRIDWNAIALAEEALSCAYADILDSMKVCVSTDPEHANFMRAPVRTVIALLWAGLQEAHPTMTRRDVGELMHVVGHDRAVNDILLRAWSYILPVAQPDDPPADPQTPAA